MAIRKNKKFIDPRYFMDEKTDVIEEDVEQSLGDRVSKKLSHAGIAREPEKVRNEIIQMILGLDTGDEVDAEALSSIGAYLKDASSANVRLQLGLEEGFENVTPENIQIVADAFKQVAISFSPAIIMPALVLLYKELKQKKTDKE
tara:strand:+ start:333 stop:767 length:435 start_codon:yes stop_codon:yes gene_type:complete